MHWMRRGEPRSKSLSRMRTAGCFRPSPVLKYVESVRNHETGLERGQWLLRKLRIKVATACSRILCLWHSNSQLSSLILTPFEPRFVILDRFDAFEHSQEPKTSRGTYKNRRFWTRLSSPLLFTDTVILSFLGNHWPLSSPVSISWTDITPVNTSEGKNDSAVLFRAAEFRQSPLSSSCSIGTMRFRRYLG